MIYHFLSSKISAIIFIASLFGSEYDNDALNFDSLSSLFYNQDLNIDGLSAAPLKDDIENTLFANENLCSFINLLKSLRGKLNNVKKNKNIHSVNDKALDITKSLIEESLMAAKMYHNRVGFFVYLSSSIDLIEDLLPYFKMKMNYENVIKLPEMIKLVLSDILNLEVLLPVIIKLLEKEEIMTKSLHYKYLKKNLYELEKHCCYFKKCFERYWSIFTFYFQFYNNMKFQPDELLIKLKNKRKVVLILNEIGFRKQSSLYNDVYVFFKDLFKCLENESICLRLLFKDLDNIWMITDKIIYRSELITGNKRKY